MMTDLQNITVKYARPSVPLHKIVLALFIEFLKENPTVKVEIQGHTDNVGKDAANLKLSQNRADNIKKMLVLKGIAADRITAIGKGESEPVETNSTPEGRAKNRRIEITIGK